MPMSGGTNEDGTDRIAKTGPVVAIDGPAGSGKSTLAHRLAIELRLPYVNTGLMYRALAHRALRDGIDPSDGPALAAAASAIGFRLSGGSDRSLMIDDGAPAAELTTRGVESVVSEVSRHPEVRAVMRAAQRALGAAGCVMEGRDIGTVVFPDADVKIFLDAPLEVRTRRREAERHAADLRDAVNRRDTLDSKTNPLRPAPDAHRIDTTDLDADAVLREALAVVDAAGVRVR